MAKKEDPGARRKPSEAEIVDRLLKQLPHADPTLGAGTSQTRRQPTPRGPMAAAKPLSRPDRHMPPPSPLKTWGWAVMSMLAAVGLTQWPYAHSCGWGVLFYLTGVTIVLAAAFWGAIVSWKSHGAVPHVISLGVVAFAGILFAREVLPRTGYARAAATWRCVAEPVGAGAQTQPAATDSAGADSAASPSELGTPRGAAGATAPAQPPPDR